MSSGFNFSFSRSHFESSTRACSVAVGLNSISDFLRCYLVPSVGGAFSDLSIYSTSAIELFLCMAIIKGPKNNATLLFPLLVSLLGEEADYSLAICWHVLKLLIHGIPPFEDEVVNSQAKSIKQLCIMTSHPFHFITIPTQRESSFCI